MRQHIKYIFYFLTLSPLALISQNEGQQSKWELGFVFSPELSYQSKSSDQELAYSNNLGYSGTINLRYALTEQISFRFGLGMAQRRFERTQKNLVFASDIDPINGVTSTSDIVISGSYLNFHAPIDLLYSPNGDNLFFACGAEVAYQEPQTLLQSRIVLSNGNKEESASRKSGVINLGLRIGMGYRFPISERIYISSEGYLKYYFKEFLIEKSPPYNLGLRFGVNLSL